MPKNSRLASALIIVSTIFSPALREAAGQGDDFDDGNADSWTELTPLDGLGVEATYSFPDEIDSDGKSYRMRSTPSPDEDTLGASRLGSIREDVSYTDFYQFVDVVDHDQGLRQNIGMLARVSDPGLGTLNGYAVTYNSTDQKLFFSVITDEVGPNEEVDVFVDPGEPVRLVFEGKGTVFKFELFRLSDLESPVASLLATDATWASGSSGIFVVADGLDATDCTFDNYFAVAEEPSGNAVVALDLLEEVLMFEFLSHPNKTYSLWESADLTIWEEVDDSIEPDLDVTTRFELMMPDLLRNYYQFRTMD